jgi:hypothetical protein
VSKAELIAGGLSWWLIAGMLVVPFIPAWFLAAMFRRRNQSEVGNAVATGVVFVGLLLCVGAEYVNIEQRRMACVAAEVACQWHPSKFSRFAIFGGIAFVQIFTIYLADIVSAERRNRAQVWK